MFTRNPTPVDSKTHSNHAVLPSNPLQILKEGWLWLAILAGVYLIVILYSYNPQDPSWSHITTNTTHNAGGTIEVFNAGGIIGAFIADILLYIFGVSAWWLVIFCFYLARLQYLKLIMPVEKKYQGISIVGFIILLLSSSALEGGHLLTTHAKLPLFDGGIVGVEFDRWLRLWLGYWGATMALITLWAVGFSVFINCSWLTILGKIGLASWGLYSFIVHRWQTYQDKKQGKQVEESRQELVEAERERLRERPPTQIEKPVQDIEKSTRVYAEKQVSLFNNAPIPPLELLDTPAISATLQSAESLEFVSRLIEQKLIDFGITVKVLTALPGPVITRYEFEPIAGVKGSQILNLAKDLARALSVPSVRVVEIIPGKTCMGLEIPNTKRQIVYLSEIMSSAAYENLHSALTISLGKDIAGNPVVADLAKMPHVLIAGTTGSGKSVAINALILSLLYKADASKVRLIMIDPKMLELSVYDRIPHLLAPVVTDMKQATHALSWCVAEMERRYKIMSMLGVRNLASFNQKISDAAKHGETINNPLSLTPDNPEPLEELPFIVVVVDELADLMMVMGKKIEELIARLTQKARASGIHLVLATQRPSVDVITGLIKANIPTRIAFQVSSKIDSRTILDQMGAEALLGQGDMLYLPPGSGYPQRIHGAFVSDQEVHRVVDYVRTQGTANYVQDIFNDNTEKATDDTSSHGDESDPLYDEAVAIVLKTRRPSVSLVQRHLRIGYNRAARLLEEMEKSGLVSAMQSNGNREILVNGENYS